MRRISRGILGVGFFIWLVFFSLQANAAKAQRAELAEDLKNAPEWVFNPRQGAAEGELAALGITRTENGRVNEAIKIGLTRAVEELAMVGKTHVSSLMKSKMSFPVDKPENGEEYVGEAFKILIPDKLRELAVIVKEKDTWISPGGDIYVLAVADKKKVKDIVGAEDKQKWVEYIRSFSSVMSREFAPTEEHEEHYFAMYHDGQMQTYIDDKIDYKSETDSGKTSSKSGLFVNIPEWVAKGRYDSNKRLLWGVGSAGIGQGGLGLAIIEARATARNELAKNLADLMRKRKVEEKIVVPEAHVGQNEERTKISFALTIPVSEQKDVWVSPRGEVFVLVEAEL